MRPSVLSNRIARLESIRERLKDHAALMGSRFGRIERPIHEILCAAKYYGQQLGEYRILLDNYEINQAKQFIINKVEEDEERLRVFKAAYNRIQESYGSVEAHPWRGVTNLDLQPFDSRRIVQLLEAWKRLLGNCRMNSLDYAI